MYRRILWMNDLSDRSDLCLEPVRLLAGLDGAEVIVAYATGSGAVSAEASDPVGQERSQGGRDAGEHLKRLVADLALEKAAPRVVPGRASDATHHMVQELDVDLVVVGSTGVSGLDRLLVGSTAVRILREALAPVLVCKRPFSAIRRILCPVASDSWVSDSGISHATRLAKATGAEVTFLAVVRGGFEDLTGARKRLEEHVVEELGGPIPAGWRVMVAIHDKPVSGILAEAGSVDCVVLSSSERRGLERLLLGSVTEEVVRGCPVSVLVAR